MGITPRCSGRGSPDAGSKFNRVPQAAPAAERRSVIPLMPLDESPPPSDVDAAWPSGRQYLAVRRAIEDEWQRCEPAFPGSGLHFVLASEWSQEGSKYPGGSPVRAWIRDGGGLRPITMQEYARVEPGDEWGRLSYVAIAFHVCADGRHVVYSASAGGRAQFGGGRCWIDPADPRLYEADGCV